MLKCPALGQACALGVLYDARTDSFVSLSLLSQPAPPSAITTDIPSSVVKYCELDSYREKFNDLDVGPQLGASFLAGLVSVGGSGRYLTSMRESSQMVQRSLVYNINTSDLLGLEWSGSELKSTPSS